jgi:cholesterol oxidase
MVNISTTTHILDGTIIGRDASTVVVDRDNRLFRDQNLLVCDGSTIPADPRVSPSLTINAIAEHAMNKCATVTELAA